MEAAGNKKKEKDRRDKNCIAKQTYTFTDTLIIHTVRSQQILKAMHFLVAYAKAGRRPLRKTAATSSAHTRMAIVELSQIAFMLKS